MVLDVRLGCVVRPDGTTALRALVRERPLLGEVRVEGADAVPTRNVRDRIEIAEGAPLDPALVTRSAAAIDSLYEARGLYLSQVEVDSVPAGDRLDLVFRIREGRRHVEASRPQGSNTCREEALRSRRGDGSGRGRAISGRSGRSR